MARDHVSPHGTIEGAEMPLYQGNSHLRVIYHHRIKPHITGFNLACGGQMVDMSTNNDA